MTTSPNNPAGQEELDRPCEYCGESLPEGVDKKTRRIRSYHFAECKVRLAQKEQYALTDLRHQAPAIETGQDGRLFPQEFEVWQGDEMVASASGPRDDALREATRYAAEYSQDGPVRVFEVSRTLIDAAMPTQQKGGSDGVA